MPKIVTMGSLVSLASLLLGVALGCDTMLPTAGSSPVTPQGVHGVYCQTPEFPSYVKFTTPSHPTPGGGPVCYTGIGMSLIGLDGVAQFSAGSHYGSFQYRPRPGSPSVTQPFSPGQTRYFTPVVEVVSLAINS